MPGNWLATGARDLSVFASFIFGRPRTGLAWVVPASPAGLFWGTCLLAFRSDQTMANTKISPELTIRGTKARRGDRMTRGKGWRLVVIKGRKRVFVATLLGTHNLGDKRIAVFSVPK